MPLTQPPWLQDLERVDVAVYAAVAATATPALDRTMSRLATAADHSRISAALAMLLAVGGGRRGRRAALLGMGSVALTSAFVNSAVKPVAQRRRPDRESGGVPVIRHIEMPTSRSLPSGHSAAAFAFATGVGHVLPREAVPLRTLAAAVAYSRVHTGVHYPGDVVIGALIGTTVAQLSARALDRRHPFQTMPGAS